MSRYNLVLTIIVLLGLALLTAGGADAERDKIAQQCRSIGAFEVDGVVFKCKEKVVKQ